MNGRAPARAKPPSFSGPEALADALRVLLLWTWIAPFACAALVGVGSAAATSSVLALACSVYGFLVGRSLGRSPGASRRRASLALVLVAAGALAAAVMTMGGQTLDAPREVASFFAGRAGGAVASRSLGALGTWALTVTLATAAGRWPPSFERGQREIRIGFAGFGLAVLFIILRGGPLPGETERMVLWALAHVTVALWTLSWHRSVEGWRESGQGAGRSGALAWLTAAATGVTVATLAAFALFLAPGALGTVWHTLASLGGLANLVLYDVALPLGLLAEFLIRLVRRMAGRPAFQNAVSEAPPAPDHSLEHALPGHAHYVYAALRLTAALLVVAAAVWIMSRVWRRLAEERDGRRDFVEVRQRLASDEGPRPGPPAPPPSTPARRAFWRVRRRSERAGLPARDSARDILQRAARVAEATGVTRAAVAAGRILAGYWPERYGSGTAPAQDPAALARAADVLERGLRKRSRGGGTPRTSA